LFFVIGLTEVLLINVAWQVTILKVAKLA